ncbi:MAG TPA: hypothetical protein VHS78_15510 [Candidatus Elarobacter sp.]|jgi:hypothetical protein|nr:hypothetical protein [Candidatus Elarobacter sp.]
MGHADRLREIKAEIEGLESEDRVRLRAWLGASFDGCGIRRSDDRAELHHVVYRAEGFLHDDMRTLRPDRRPTNLAWHLPGIYAIASECDWLYVGRAVHLSTRRCVHASNLRKNKHPNRLLQRHWNSTAAPIWFVILETCEDELQFRRNVRRGIEHPRELVWKQRLRPLYDHEARKRDISFLVHS